MERIKLIIEEMQEIAENRGGKCLSTEYINAHTKIAWQCEEGHIWEATPDHIKRGMWCPKCSAKERALKRRLTIEEIRELASQKGGKCLSTTYVDSRTKLTWQCKEGHIWEAVPSSIKSGTWCPKCAWKREKLNQKSKKLEEFIN